MKFGSIGAAVSAALLMSASLPLPAAEDDLPDTAKLQGAEVHQVAKLPPAGPHRVYVLEPVFPHFVSSKVWVIDGDKPDIVGMMSAGYAANFALDPKHARLYAFETYWSRGTRGKRTDLVTFYDPQTLDIKAEVTLPKGRFLVVPKKPNADVTPDGRYLLSYNLAPTTSVSVVDAKERRYKGEIELPGCGLIFPSAGSRFSSVCSDGTLATVSFDADLRSKIVRDGPFFDAENDPVFEHAAFDKRRKVVYFVSYDGNVYPVDLAQEKAVFLPQWSLRTDADKEEHWRPGGWQVSGFHSASQRLYVLMHEGARWSHKQAGHEVWVFDVKTKQRVERIKLEEHAISMAVSPDLEATHLYTLTEKPSLVIYDVASGKKLGGIEPLGISPYLLYVDGM